MNKQIYNANVSYSKMPLKLKDSPRLASSNPNSFFHFYGAGEAQDGMSNIQEKVDINQDLDIEHLVDSMKCGPQDGIRFAQLADIVEEQNSDIAQQVQLVMSRPQKKSRLFRMAGVIKEPFASDDD